MLARPSHAFVILMLFAGVATAQQAPYLPANTPDANRLLADRVKFVKENYALDQSAMNKLVNSVATMAGPAPDTTTSTTTSTMTGFGGSIGGNFGVGGYYGLPTP